MKTGKQQRGFTFWELSLYLCMFGFIVTCALKLGPHYVDDMNVAKAISGVHEALAGKDIYEVTNSDIKGRVSKFFQVSMISDEILKELEVERDSGKVLLRLNYDARTSFIGNIDIVMHFEHEVDLAQPYAK